jgi:hypothetical protein
LIIANTDLSFFRLVASARQQAAYQTRLKAKKTSVSYEIGTLEFTRRDGCDGYVTIYRQVSKYRRYRGEEFTILTFECAVLHREPSGVDGNMLMIHFGNRFGVVFFIPDTFFKVVGLARPRHAREL